MSRPARMALLLLSLCLTAEALECHRRVAGARPGRIGVNEAVARLWAKQRPAPGWPKSPADLEEGHWTQGTLGAGIGAPIDIAIGFFGCTPGALPTFSDSRGLAVFADAVSFLTGRPVLPYSDWPRAGLGEYVPEPAPLRALFGEVVRRAGGGPQKRIHVDLDGVDFTRIIGPGITTDGLQHTSLEIRLLLDTPAFFALSQFYLERRILPADKLAALLARYR